MNSTTLFDRLYDKKVAMLGICALLSAETVPPEVAETMQGLFKSVIAILSAKPVENPAQQKSDQMKELLQQAETNGVDVDLFKMLVDKEDDKPCVKHQGEDRADQLFSPIRQLDLYAHFRSTIQAIKARSPEALKTLVNYLDPSEQQKLTALLQTRNVGNSERRIVHPARSSNRQTNNLM